MIVFAEARPLGSQFPFPLVGTCPPDPKTAWQACLMGLPRRAAGLDREGARGAGDPAPRSAGAGEALRKESAFLYKMVLFRGCLRAAPTLPHPHVIPPLRSLNAA